MDVTGAVELKMLDVATLPPTTLEAVGVEKELEEETVEVTTLEEVV